MTNKTESLARLQMWRQKVSIMDHKTLSAACRSKVLEKREAADEEMDRRVARKLEKMGCEYEVKTYSACGKLIAHKTMKDMTSLEIEACVRDNQIIQLF